MAERIKREAAAFAKAKAKREKAAADSLAEAKKQYEAEMQARRDKDAAQVEAHKKMLADKKAAFEASFRNVWGTSVSGMSMFTVDIEPKEAGGKDWTSIEETIVGLFKKTLISDVRDFVDIKRFYKNDINYGSTNVNAQMNNQMKRRLTGLTNDDRVAELIEESIDIQQREDLDILIWQISDVSAEYKQWTTIQTEEMDQNNVFSDDDPFENSKPVSSEATADMQDFQKQNTPVT